MTKPGSAAGADGAVSGSSHHWQSDLRLSRIFSGCISWPSLGIALLGILLLKLQMYYSEWHQLEMTLGINAAACHMWSPSGDVHDCEWGIQEPLMPPVCHHSLGSLPYDFDCVSGNLSWSSVCFLCPPNKSPWSCGWLWKIQPKDLQSKNKSLSSHARPVPAVR